MSGIVWHRIVFYSLFNVGAPVIRHGTKCVYVGSSILSPVEIASILVTSSNFWLLLDVEIHRVNGQFILASGYGTEYFSSIYECFLK